MESLSESDGGDKEWVVQERGDFDMFIEGLIMCIVFLLKFVTVISISFPFVYK